MSAFLKFIDNLCHRFPVHVEITYNKTCDWCIYVYKRGCAEDYPGSWNEGHGNAILCYEQDCDMELCFAKAHVAVKKWLCEHEGGY